MHWSTNGLAGGEACGSGQAFQERALKEEIGPFSSLSVSLNRGEEHGRRGDGAGVPGLSQPQLDDRWPEMLMREASWSSSFILQRRLSTLMRIRSRCCGGPGSDGERRESCRR